MDSLQACESQQYNFDFPSGVSIKLFEQHSFRLGRAHLFDIVPS